MFNYEQISAYIAHQILKAIQENLNNDELNIAVKNAINQCISHVLCAKLNDEIAKKVNDFIDKNTRNICTKVIHDFIRSHSGGSLQSKLLENFSSEYRIAAKEFISENIAFSARIKEKE